MNDLLRTIRAIIIAQIKASALSRITTEHLNNILDAYRDWTDGNRSLDTEEKEILYNELKTYFTADLNYENDFVTLERGLVISDLDPSMHTTWVPDIGKRFYWRKQRDFLLSFLARKHGASAAAGIINSIDFETEAILKNMEDPSRSFFDSRGLVVGYVQSGKTANFTALISKAADAGYRFIIVLAGIHDELRQQTQIRIDRELTGHNNLNLKGDFVEWNNLDGPKRWENLTSAGWLDGAETGEFSGKGINKFKDVFLNRERPVIAIIKKNVKIMDRLIKWIHASGEKDRINVPVLIIDDEADQASVDGNATRDESDPTKTNERIRTILKAFERSAYVGYTATPFANVFISYDTVHEVLGDDLYPRNFIHSLPEPPGYFGTRRIFHDNLDEYFVSEILNPQNEKTELADLKSITEDMAMAVYSFFIGIAIRNLRGQSNYPMSMMINVDHRVERMNRIGETLDTYIRDTLPKHIDLQQLTSMYRNFSAKSESLNESLGTGNNLFDEETVINETVRVIKWKGIKVRTLNSKKDDKLDYARDPSMKVIAIGGNKLSRGLTLEGLMVTFYLRESKQFDTLLQMGRWFGYRKGYEDLVRIFTGGLLWRQFKDLAIVELEFRENVREMAEDPEGRTPADFAVGVRHILGLLPTAKNKLGAAVLNSNYGGRQVSVTRLMLEHPDLLDKNTALISELVNRCFERKIILNKIGVTDLPTLIARDVPNNIVFPFIQSFIIATDSEGSSLEFEKQELLNFINKKQELGELKNWNIALISINTSKHDNIIALPNGIKVRTVNRARLKTSPVNGAYNIKAISSKGDRMIDLPHGAVNEYDGRTNPLLLLYFIDRNSEPQDRESTTREPLYKGISNDKQRDPASYSIIFPSDKLGAGTWGQII